MNSDYQGVVGVNINLSDESGQSFIDDEIIAGDVNFNLIHTKCYWWGVYDFKPIRNDDRPEGMCRD